MSGQKKIILSEETMKGGKKGKSTFDGYAARINKTNEVTGKENLSKGSKKK